MAHPTMRKRKYGCLSGVSRAGNPWFTLQQKAHLESLTLRHSSIMVPTLIGPHQCQLASVKLAGNQNFEQFAQMLQLNLAQVNEFDLVQPSD